MIAIKEMEMPANCFDCCLPASKCHGLLFRKDRRADGCPLVEIVTCKDCKYNYENSCDFDGFGIDDEYFCAKGERKEQ